MDIKKVFIPQCPVTRNADGSWSEKFDLSSAEKYGTLQVLLNHDDKPYDVEYILSQLHIQLEKYTDEDSIICIGNPIILAWAVSIAAYYNDGVVNTLQWNYNKYERIAAQIW